MNQSTRFPLRCPLTVVVMLACFGGAALAQAPMPAPQATMSPGRSMEAGPWGQPLARFLEQAVDQHPSMAQARSGLQAAHGQVRVARWQYGPTTSFSRDTVNGGATNTFRVDQPIWSAGQLGAGVDSARAAQRGSEQDLLATRLALKTRLTNAWADWVKARHRHVLLKELAEEHEGLLAMILRRTEAGVATAADATLARARRNQVQAELAQSLLQEEHARGLLSRQAGIEVTSLLAQALGDGSGPRPPAPPGMAELLDRVRFSPEMEKARAGVEMARQEVVRRRGQMYPTVSLRYENQTGAVRDQRIGLAVSMNFGAGLSSLDALSVEQARVAAAMNAADALERDLVDRYQQESTRHGVAAAAVVAGRDTTVFTQQVLESYRRQFANGKRAWLDLLNMVRESHAARLAQMDAEVEELAGLFRLQLLMDDVAVPPPSLSALSVRSNGAAQ